MSQLPPPIPNAQELPPPIPNPRQGVFFHLARASWVSVLIAFGITVLVTVGLQGKANPVASMVVGVACGIVALIGILSGVIALFGIARHGWRGLLLPALTGLFLWLLLFAIATPAFLRARHLAQQRQISKPAALEPVVHSPDAKRIQDPVLAYSFDLPPGYTPVPEPAKLKGNYAQAFMCRIGTEMPCMLMVQHLSGELSRQRLSPLSLPPNSKATLETFRWRGREVDGFRVPEKVNGRDYVTYNVQIPLKGKAIQVGFGGPGEAATQLRALAVEVLATLDGQPAW